MMEPPNCASTVTKTSGSNWKMELQNEQVLSVQVQSRAHLGLNAIRQALFFYFQHRCLPYYQKNLFLSVLRSTKYEENDLGFVEDSRLVQLCTCVRIQILLYIWFCDFFISLYYSKQSIITLCYVSKSSIYGSKIFTSCTHNFYSILVLLCRCFHITVKVIKLF